jgi:hypothetical protein
MHSSIALWVRQVIGHLLQLLMYTLQQQPPGIDTRWLENGQLQLRIIPCPPYLAVGVCFKHHTSHIAAWDLRSRVTDMCLATWSAFSERSGWTCVTAGLPTVLHCRAGAAGGLCGHIWW